MELSLSLAASPEAHLSAITICEQKIELICSSINDYKKDIDSIQKKFDQLKDKYSELREAKKLYKAFSIQLESDRFKDNPHLLQRKEEYELKKT